jgi:hypothetical protein
VQGSLATQFSLPAACRSSEAQRRAQWALGHVEGDGPDADEIGMHRPVARPVVWATPLTRWRRWLPVGALLVGAAAVLWVPLPSLVAGLAVAGCGPVVLANVDDLRDRVQITGDIERRLEPGAAWVIGGTYALSGIVLCLIALTY